MEHISENTMTCYFDKGSVRSFYIDFAAPYNFFYEYVVIRSPNNVTYGKINLDNILRSGWLKSEFLQFLSLSKRSEEKFTKYSYYEKCKFAINDLESNLDKYLNEALIENIIK